MGFVLLKIKDYLNLMRKFFQKPVFPIVVQIQITITAKSIIEQIQSGTVRFHRHKPITSNRLG